MDKVWRGEGKGEIIESYRIGIVLYGMEMAKRNGKIKTKLGTR
jgi:hypothetical protein